MDILLGSATTLEKERVSKQYRETIHAAFRTMEAWILTFIGVTFQELVRKRSTADAVIVLYL